MSKPLYLTHARVVTPERVLDDSSILIEDGLIAAIHESAASFDVSGAETIDLRGHTLLPGLVYLHCDAILRPPRFRCILQEADSSRSALQENFYCFRESPTAPGFNASTRSRSATGFTKWRSKPAATERSRSLGCPYPDNAKKRGERVCW